MLLIGIQFVQEFAIVLLFLHRRVKCVVRR
jgi:hypothetical protein